MMPEELDEVIDDLQRLQLCRKIMASVNGAGVVVKVSLSPSGTTLLISGEEARPLTQQIEQRIIARLQGKGVAIPGVGT